MLLFFSIWTIICCILWVIVKIIQYKECKEVSEIQRLNDSGFFKR